MRLTKTYLGPTTLLTAALALSACAAASDEADGEHLGETQQEIINGSNAPLSYNAVALYRKTTGTCFPDAADKANGYTKSFTVNNVWWPRPCSGMVIRKDGDVQYIVTARHCITQDGSLTGPILTGSTSIKAISSLNPGVLDTTETNGSMTVLESPPASARNGSVFYEDYETYGDIAIVKTTGSLSPTDPVIRPGFRGISAKSAPLGLFLNIRGYGRSKPGDCYTHATSGAGRLRTASTNVMQTPNFTTFVHEMNSDDELAHGDSGGPLLRGTVYNGAVAWILFGVNTTPTTATGGANLADFFQAAFGNIYLTPESGLVTNQVVNPTSLAAGSVVVIGLLVDTANARMRVSRADGYLRYGSYCLSDEGNNQAVRLRSCGTLGTQWKQTGSGVIMSTASRRCLTTSGVSLTTVACNEPTTKWAFTADAAF